MIRLIATDLDGTLLDPSGRIPTANRDALLAAADAGVRVVVATGRPIRWLECLDDVRDAEPLVIVSNGAALYDLARGTVVRSHPLPPSVLRSLVADLGGAVDGLSFGLERGDLFGCEPGSLSLHADWPETVIAPVAELLDRVSPVVKLLAYHDELSSDALASHAEPVVGDRAVVTHSLTHARFGMVELSARGITKASLLAELCTDLGVEPSEVAAFGDMPNDRAMLEFAGRSFVMANAHASLRACFEVIGSNADAGVAGALRRILDAAG